jgi:hypothetical protein
MPGAARWCECEREHTADPLAVAIKTANKGEQMKAALTLAALALTAIAAPVQAAPKWIAVTDTGGEWSFDAHSVQATGTTVQFWVRNGMPPEELRKTSAITHDVMHVRAECGGTSMTIDRYIGYDAHDKVVASSMESDTDSVPSESVWEYIINTVCESQHIRY